jgi:hypothetical protein
MQVKPGFERLEVELDVIVRFTQTHESPFFLTLFILMLFILKLSTLFILMLNLEYIRFASDQSLSKKFFTTSIPFSPHLSASSFPNSYALQTSGFYQFPCAELVGGQRALQVDPPLCCACCVGRAPQKGLLIVLKTQDAVLALASLADQQGALILLDEVDQLWPELRVGSQSLDNGGLLGSSIGAYVARQVSTPEQATATRNRMYRSSRQSTS